MDVAGTLLSLFFAQERELVAPASRWRSGSKVEARETAGETPAPPNLRSAAKCGTIDPRTPIVI